MRFNALQKNIPDISQKMLTITLRTLEEDGVVQKCRQDGQRQTYSFHVLKLCFWRAKA